MIEDIFFVSLYIGEQSFEGERHLKNFVRYLFSLSKAHKQNEYTKYNSYTLSNSNNIIFVESPGRQYEDFLQQCNINADKLVNKLYYFLYAILINDKVYTNIVRKQDGDIIFSISQELLKHLIKATKFDKNLILRELSFYAEDKDVLPYQKSTQNDRKILSELFHQKVKTKDDVITILHADQMDLLHIHTISKEK